MLKENLNKSTIKELKVHCTVRHLDLTYKEALNCHPYLQEDQTCLVHGSRCPVLIAHEQIQLKPLQTTTGTWADNYYETERAESLRDD